MLPSDDIELEAKLKPTAFCTLRWNKINKFNSMTTVDTKLNLGERLTGGWEFDHSHGAGTSSPSHRQQVEEQAPKPVGWTMCFLLMTLVPVQKLCVNIYVYICVYSPYTSSVIGRIYNGSVIQYWRSCTPSRSIGECAVPDLNAILCFLWFTNCVLLFDNNLILGCLWHYVFV